MMSCTTCLLWCKFMLDEVIAKSAGISKLQRLSQFYPEKLYVRPRPHALWGCAQAVTIYSSSIMSLDGQHTDMRISFSFYIKETTCTSSKHLLLLSCMPCNGISSEQCCSDDPFSLFTTAHSGAIATFTCWSCSPFHSMLRVITT